MIDIKKQDVITSDFYDNETITIAKKLLGTLLVHESNEGRTAVIIVETDAYLSNDDRAGHDARGKTKRNEAMFERAGIAYVYLIYGNHYCFNVVTHEKDTGEAVLIRALEPIEGVELMKKRRSPKNKLNELTSGPGKLCSAMGITKEHNKTDLKSSPLYLTTGINFKNEEISSSKRIGISKGKEKPWRFYTKDNKFVSR